MPPSTQTRTIKLVVDSQGVKAALDSVSKSMGTLNKNTSSIASNFNLLRNSLSGYLGALGVREIARMSDEMQNLGNRLKIVSKQGEDSRQVMEGLLELANETQQSVSDVAEVYVRLGSSLKAANASSESLLAVSKALINSFRVSGSTGTETSATIIQLSQAFASGTLRGQELRSVMLQNAELASILRERFGKDLAKKAEAGLISITEVLKLVRDNMERINASAKVLAPTFEQTIVKAFNRVKIALFDINREFGLSEKFAKLINVLTDSIFVLVSAIAELAYYLNEEINWKLVTISVAGFVAVFFPLQTALAASVATLVYLSDGMGDIIDRFRNLGAWAVQLRIWILELSLSIEKNLLKSLSLVGQVSQENINSLALQLDEINRLRLVADELGADKFGGQSKAPKQGSEKKAIDDLIVSLEKLGYAADGVEKTKDLLAALNKEFLKGSLSVQEYGGKLISFEIGKLNKEFKEGKVDLIQYTERINSVKIADFTQQLNQGSISLAQYNAKVSELKIEQLNQQFETGRITLVAYNDELVKISQKFEPSSALISGTSSYIESIGTLSSNVADSIKQTFGALEDSLVEFIKTGKFNFRDFTQAILDDLTKIIVRAAIIRPLAEGILGSFAPGASGAAGGTSFGGFAQPAFAKGGVFDNGIKKFASGGVVDSPTVFGYGRGNTGVMGEAGPEAILPLERGAGGKLGVSASVTPVTINVINNTNAQVDQKETQGPNGEKTIELIITSKVREGLASGVYDKTLQQSYGLTRRGS